MVRSRVVLFFVLVLISALSAQVFIRYKVAQRDALFAQVNMAGRQRMLSQAIVKTGYALLRATERTAEDPILHQQALQNYVEQFEQAQAELLTYAQGHTGAFEVLAKMEAQAQPMLLHARALMEAQDSAQVVAQLEGLLAEQPIFLETMEATVAAFEGYGSQVLKELTRWQAIASAFSYLVLLGAFYLVMRPMIKALRKSNEELVLQNQELAASEEEIRSQHDQLSEMNEALELSRRQKRVLMDQAPTAMALFDTELCYLVASGAWIEEFGVPTAKVRGKHFFELSPPMEAEWKPRFEACLQGKKQHDSEYRLVRPDGTEQWLSWDLRPWHDALGNVGGVLMVAINITESRQQDTEQERLQKLTDQMSKIARMGMWEVDLVNNSVYWSPVTKAIHEVEPSFEPDLEGGINFYKEGESRDMIQQVVGKAIAEGESFDVELQLVTAKGKDIWVRAIGEPEFEDGKCARIVGVFQDVNNRVKRDEHNRHLLATLGGILESATEVSIIATDLEGTINHFGTGAEHLLQYTAEEMVGKQTPALIHKEAEIVARAQVLSEELGREVKGFDAFVALAREGKPDTQTWTYVRKDGTQFQVQLSVTAMKDIEGSIVGFLGIAVDLTEVQQLTERLSRQNAQLSDYAHISSHNLRAPISNLNSLVYYLKEAQEESDRSNLMEMLETVVTNLTETLDNLLQSLIIREGNYEDTEYVKFEEAFGRAKDSLVAQLSTTEVSIAEDFSQVPGLPYKRDFMESILLNLLSNALKYRAEDRPLSVEISTFFDDNLRPTLKFSDNGVGIDLERHGKKLFGLNKTFHRHEDARGVGLFLTKSHVEAMGGTIRAESQVDVGTSFTITF